MFKHEELLLEAERLGLCIYEKRMPPKFKGLYSDNVIWINNRLTHFEKACILAEELGHYHKTIGNILDQGSLLNRKQENLARTWAYKRLVPLSKLVQALLDGVSNHYELAEYLGVPEDFLDSALKRYQETYGLSVRVGGYVLYFTPIKVEKIDF